MDKIGYIQLDRIEEKLDTIIEILNEEIEYEEEEETIEEKKKREIREKLKEKGAIIEKRQIKTTVKDSKSEFVETEEGDE